MLQQPEVGGTGWQAGGVSTMDYAGGRLTMTPYRKLSELDRDGNSRPRSRLAALPAASTGPCNRLW